MQQISPQKPNKNLPQTIPEQQHIMAKKIKNFIYNPNECIGSGFSSQVFKGINQINNEPIAIKAIQLNKVQNEVQRYLLSNEIAALKAVKHPNVINTIDILMTKNNVYIVTEYCQQGDLQKYISQAKAAKQKQPKNSPIDLFPIIHPYEALKLVEKILMGYEALEEKGILHRDLKTANIFLKKLNREIRQGPPVSQIPDNLLQSTAKIADFGFCQMMDGDPAKRPQIAYNVGSPAYMSPQSYKQNFYSSKSDLWSIGIILYQMLMGDTPDRSLTYDQMADNLNQGKLKLPFVGIAGDHNNDNLRRIFINCFKKNLNERYSSKAMLEDIKGQIQRLQKSGFGSYKNPSISEIRNITGKQSQTIDRNLRQQTPTYHSNVQKNFRLSTDVNLNNDKKIQPKNEDFAKKTFKSVAGSPSHAQIADLSVNLRSSIQMMLFLYRLLKFITDTTIKQAQLTRLIIFRHRSFIQQSLGKIEPNQTLRQYQYLKSRFDQTYMEKQTTQNNNSSGFLRLNQLANQPFASSNSMKVYKQIFKDACFACQHYIFGPVKTEEAVVDYNKVGIMWDYLILQYQILESIEKGQSLTSIIESTSLSFIVKQQPKKLVSAHYQLLKLKSQAIMNGTLQRKAESDSHRKTKSQIFNTKVQQKPIQFSQQGQQQPYFTSIMHRPNTGIPIENIVNQNPMFLRQTVDPEVLRQKYQQLDKFNSSEQKRSQQMDSKGIITINMHPQVRTQVRNQPFKSHITPFQIQHMPQRKTFH